MVLEDILDLVCSAVEMASIRRKIGPIWEMPSQGLRAHCKNHFYMCMYNVDLHDNCTCLSF